MLASVFLLLLVLLAGEGRSEESAEAASAAGGHVSVVIVGGTGDLARKYLWQGFFQLYVNHASATNTFSFFGGGLSPDEKGTPALFEILKAVSCPPEVKEQRCAVLKEQFLRLARYKQLKTAEDYQELDRLLRRQLKEEGLREAGRLFYLSVPAFAYADIADNINGSCRPRGEAWLRVVLEKPFGHDLRSAQVLSAQLGNSLRDEEMYRIDHYLGKQVVSKILPFREANKKFLDPIWNRNHIERVEIVLKETLDVKGRIPFYDQYGVIRDVLQNHLTEVMTLLTMRLPANLSNSKEVLRSKLQVLSSLLPLGKKQALLGQYQSYQSEVQKELNRTKDHVSLTPTFAAVVAHLDEPELEGVPILLVSGKMLDERVGYARVLFKSDVFCVQRRRQQQQRRDGGGGGGGVHCQPKQLIFYFGHGDLQYPAILVSKNLFRPALVDEEWREVTEQKEAAEVLGSPLSDFYVQTPGVQREAYAQLIAHIFAGRKDSFISTETLLASWTLWTPLLSGLSAAFPRIYPGGADNADMLDLRLDGKELAFVSEPVIIGQDRPMEWAGGASAGDFQVTQGKFRGASMVSAWSEELVERLASDLQASAEAAVRRHGVFHLALSGGSTPVALFQRLAQQHLSFPWGRTHVWMADERCVPLADPESNFHNVHQHLLRHVRVPYYNLHPMPVELNQRLCVEEDGAAPRYERELGLHVNGSRLHFVLLGAGYDGHTASLFPGAATAAAAGDGGRLVALTESPVKPHRRMSLTLAAINRAQKVALLVMGKGKHELVTQLSRVTDAPEKYPVTGVRPSDGSLFWYIDYDALLG